MEHWFAIGFVWASVWFTLFALFLIPRGHRKWWKVLIAMLVGGLFWWGYVCMEVISRSRIVNNVRDDKEHSLFGER